MQAQQDHAELIPPGAPSAPLAYLRQVWNLRHYVWQWGNADVQATIVGTSLGAAWLFLEPVLTIAIYWIVFGLVLDISRGVDNYLAFLTVGHISFSLAQRTLLGASGSLLSHTAILRSMVFPRAVVPLARAARSLSIFRAEAVVLLAALGLMGVHPGSGWLLLPLIGLLHVALAAALGIGLARFVYQSPDLQRALTHVMRLAFYGSGVFFPLEAFVGARTWLTTIATINPFFSLVELTRWAMLGLTPSNPGLVLLSIAVWMAAAMVIGGRVFLARERDYSGARTVRR